MCSLPSRISSSWRPSLFFCGHRVSSSLGSVRFLSLDHPILNQVNALQDFAVLDDPPKFIDNGVADAHYNLESALVQGSDMVILTLFANQRVVAVVGVVRISRRRATAVAQHAKVKLYDNQNKSVPSTSTVTNLETRGRTGLDGQSWES